MKWFSLWAHNAGVVSSNPTLSTMKKLLLRKVMIRHLEKLHLPNKDLPPWFSLSSDQVCYFFYFAIRHKMSFCFAVVQGKQLL